MADLFKFKIDSKQYQELEAKLKKNVHEILADKAYMDDIGGFLVERIKYQARIGRPMNSDEAFPALKESTIANRRSIAKNNPTHDTYKESRSNLTITGKFLDALKYLIKGPGLVSVFWDGDHPGYRPNNRSVKNEALANWLKEKGFVVFDSSIKDNPTVKKRITTIVLGYIRRGLKVRNK